MATKTKKTTKIINRKALNPKVVLNYLVRHTFSKAATRFKCSRGKIWDTVKNNPKIYKTVTKEHIAETKSKRKTA